MKIYYGIGFEALYLFCGVLEYF